MSLFRLPRRYEDNRPVCAACYLELVGRDVASTTCFLRWGMPVRSFAVIT